MTSLVHTKDYQSYPVNVFFVSHELSLEYCFIINAAIHSPAGLVSKIPYWCDENARPWTHTKCILRMQSHYYLFIIYSYSTPASWAVKFDSEMMLF